MTNTHRYVAPFWNNCDVFRRCSPSARRVPCATRCPPEMTGAASSQKRARDCGRRWPGLFKWEVCEMRVRVCVCLCVCLQGQPLLIHELKAGTGLRESSSPLRQGPEKFQGHLDTDPSDCWSCFPKPQQTPKLSAEGRGQTGRKGGLSYIFHWIFMYCLTIFQRHVLIL